MKSCLRTAANLVRRCKIHRDEHSGWDKAAARANVATSERAKRKAAVWETGNEETVQKKVLRKLLKEFAVSGTIERVAKDYLLTGMTFIVRVRVCACRVSYVGDMYTSKSE